MGKTFIHVFNVAFQEMQGESQVRKMMEIMNRHVPSKRRSLDAMLRSNEAEYSGKDGNHYHIKRGELKLLASIIEESERRRLKVPIIIMTDTSYGREGAWKVMGRTEVKVVSRIIGRGSEYPEEIRLFHPHLVQLRRALPTATTILYSP